MNLQGYFAVALLFSFVFLVVIRILTLRKQGIRVVEFGKKDKKDFLLPPFVVLYFYLVMANVFNLPTIQNQQLFYFETLSWIGVIVCSMGFILFIWALVSFKKSFRVGIKENCYEGLVTTGAFAVSRNPIYVAFTIILIGEFFVFPSWILLIYIIGGIWTFNRQIIREEAFLSEQYGEKFLKYCNRVRRWI